MPKTSVNKHKFFLAGKYKIRTAWKVFRMLTVFVAQSCDEPRD
jgi:hypothetical protein